jgi:hypothetical protein
MSSTIVSPGADGDRVLVVDVRPALRADGQRDGQIGQGLVVAGGDLAAAIGVALQLVQLGQAERGLDVRHAEVVAQDVVVVTLLHALVAVQPDPVRQPVVVGGDEAALGGRHVLGGVHAESGVAEAAGLAAPVQRAVGLAGVLDHRQSVAVGDGLDGVHVRHDAEQADRDDGPRPGRDGGLDAAGIHQVRVGLDVHEDRRGAREEDRGHRGVEGVRDGDDLVARAVAQPGEERHQRRRAVRHGHRVLDAAVGRPALLQLRDLLALGDHAAAEDFRDGVDLLLAEIGTCGRDHRLAPVLEAGLSSSAPLWLLMA